MFAILVVNMSKLPQRQNLGVSQGTKFLHLVLLGHTLVVGCLDLVVPCSSLVAGQVLVGICGCWFKK